MKRLSIVCITALMLAACATTGTDEAKSEEMETQAVMPPPDEACAVRDDDGTCLCKVTNDAGQCEQGGGTVIIPGGGTVIIPGENNSPAAVND